MPGPLAGIRVLDLTQGLPGPFATRLLADFGADVVKVEPPGGDPARSLPPFQGDEPHREKSGLFLFLNLNKRGVVLDLESPADRSTVLELAAASDLVVEGFRPGTLEALGIGYGAMTAVRPDTILVSLTDFGQTGPYRDYRGSDTVLYAMGGDMYHQGLAGRSPLKQGGTAVLFQAGGMTAAASVAALRARRVYGQGQWVDLSMYEQSSSNDRRAQTYMIWQFSGYNPPRAEGAFETLGTGVFPCADGYVEILGDEVKWDRLLELIEAPATLRDERWRRPGSRSDPELKAEFDAAWYPWLLSHGKLEIWEACQQRGLLSGPLNTSEELFNNEVFKARGFWVDVDHPAMGRVTVPGRPAVMNVTPWELRRPAPLLGEHTADVLSEVRAARKPGGAVGPSTGRAVPAPEHRYQPLAGIRVLDVAVVWAGPYTSQIMADLGAEVIKVENIHGFQPHTRSAKAHMTKEEVGPASGWQIGFPDHDPREKPYERDAWYLPLLRNKKSVTINLLTPEGQEYFHRLVAKSDVVWENNVPATMERLGITYEELSKHRPDLVMLRAPAFGLSGPYKNRRGFGSHIEAFTGHTMLRGYTDMDPSSNTPVYAGDYHTAGVGVFAVLAALEHRDRTGEGQLIELAQAENSTQLFPQSLMDYVLNGRVQTTIGNRDAEGFAPNGVYGCAGDDRWIAITVFDDEQWRALARLVGGDRLAADERYATREGRERHHDELDGLIEGWTAGREHLELMAELQAAGVPAGAVMDAPEALASPQLEAREFWEQIEHRFTGTWTWPGPPFRMGLGERERSLPPPGLGEHNEYVYKEIIGASDAEYEDLMARGEIGTEYGPEIP